MNLTEVKPGEEHIVRKIISEDEELKKFLFSHGCYCGEPGAYSMSPFTSEESITSSYVKNENPDVIINIVDVTNLSRSLFFTTQLLELGIPVVVALNKSDVNAKKGTKIQVDKLSEKLGCPVIETVSTSSNGLKEVVTKAISISGKNQIAPYVQDNIEFHDKDEVEKSDRKRFDFVNGIVKEVETRKILTKEKNIDNMYCLHFV